MSFCVVLESVNSIILIRQVFKLVPFTSFEIFQSLVIFKFFSENFFGSILDFVFKLKLVFFSHLHFDSFDFFFLFVILEKLIDVFIIFVIGLILKS